MRRVLDRFDAKVVYSRVMSGAFVIGGTDAYTAEIAASVLFEPIDGNLTTLAGSIQAEVLAATITRPSTPVDYVMGQALPSFLWTVERDEVGTVALVLREITRDSVSTPLHFIALESEPSDAYFLSGGWTSDDSAILSVSNALERRWAAFDTGGMVSASILERRASSFELFSVARRSSTTRTCFAGSTRRQTPSSCRSSSGTTSTAIFD